MEVAPVPVLCPSPPEISNGRHDSDPGARVKSGSIVEYQCNSEQFTLFGSAQIVCQPNGEYDGPAPTCRGKISSYPAQ
jgi:hypothetical protein